MPVLTIFDRWLHNHSGTGERDRVALYVVAEKSRISHTTLETWIINPERVGPIPFVIADRLLCACDLSDAWRGPLVDYYYAVDMNWGVCECPGCINSFWVDPHRKGSKQRYCSKPCTNAASRIRLGKQEARAKNYGGGGVARKGGKCRNGHTRTETNWRTMGNGRVRCIDCEHEANVRAYARKKEAKVAA